MNKYLIGGAALLVVALAMSWYAVGSQSNVENADGLTPVSSFDHAHGMALDPVDDSKVYIATHEGLYVLQNDSNLFRIGSSKDDLMGFMAHPTKSNTFFSSGHPARGGNIGFQKSTDGGMTWEKVSQGLGGPVDFHAMTVSTANPDVAYGYFGGKLQKSVDGGKTWTYAKGAIAPISLVSDPTRENVVYAATQNGVQISEDTGDSWRSISTALEGGAVSVFALNPSDPQNALVFSETLGGLGKSTDGGKTWEKINEAFGGGAVLYIAFSKVQPKMVYALTNQNVIYKSSDGGDTWQNIRP